MIGVMAFFVAGPLTPTNVSLLEACRALGNDAALLPLDDVARRSLPGDVVLPRLDVLPTLDGVEPGLRTLDGLARRGVRLVNSAGALLAAHDKLATAVRLGLARVPHPRTAHVDEGGPVSPLPFPVVVKPRFGSWGRDVVRCDSGRELAEALAGFSERTWFRRQGALVQELVPPLGYDLRVLVAFGTVVGAVQRVAAEGEWRTNVALGGRRVATVPSAEACLIAISAAEAIGASFVGVDLLPTRHGWTVIEVNGCVDFTNDYAFPGEDAFVEAARALVGPTEAAAPFLPLEAVPALD